MHFFCREYLSGIKKNLSGHAQFEFTDNRIFRDADYNATKKNILDITVYLSHQPETQVNRTNIQSIQVVKNRSFMRNEGHVFGVRTFTDRKKCPVRNVSGNIGYIK